MCAHSKYKIKITGQDTMLPPGKWAFPFTFMLPTHGKKGGKLTGSFKVTDKGHAPGWSGGKFSAHIKNLKAKVEYSLKACVDLEGCKDLEKKIDFTVFEQLPNAVVNPSDVKTANVMYLCCINKGSCTIKGSLEKNFYCPGEEARAICEITNNSTLPIQAQAEMNRLMRLKADHHTLRHRNMVKLGKFDVIQPGETKTVNMMFRIPNSHPTTNGHYIECRYIMDIVASISMAPDIELHFPVNIFMPQIPPASYLAELGDVSSYQVMPNACVVAPMPLAPGYM